MAAIVSNTTKCSEEALERGQRSKIKIKVQELALSIALISTLYTGHQFFIHPQSTVFRTERMHSVEREESTHLPANEVLDE